MSFSLRLSPDLVAVEPGSTMPLNVAVVNRGEKAEQYELSVEGLDPEWIATPQPMFTADPGDEHVEKVFFRPARTSESLAGNYPFVVRVRSLETGETRTAQAVLQIKPYNHLSMEVSPRKGYVSPTKQQNTFTVTVMNLGNTDQTLQLFGNDPEDECAYQFEQEQFTLGPGQTKTLEATVDPKSRRFFSSTRLFGFSISGRSVNAPSVVASAQAQLEQRALFSPGTVAFLFLVLLIGLAWFAFLPKPPTLTLNADRLRAQKGETVTFSWTARDANRVVLRLNGEELATDAPQTGSQTVPAEGSQLIFEATPFRDSRAGATKQQIVEVQTPPDAPEPKVVSFSTEKREVYIGESVLLRYRLNPAVTRATLAPLNQALPLSVDEIEVTPSRVGKIEYTLVAENAAGKVDKRSITITVLERIDVSIDSFTVTPLEANVNDAITISWRVSKAAKVTLKIGTETVDVESEGTRTIPLTESTTIALIALDDQNRSVRREKRVRIRPAVDPVPLDPEPTIPPIGSTAGG